jgi:DNA mismatch repair ATPase MutS
LKTKAPGRFAKSAQIAAENKMRELYAEGKAKHPEALIAIQCGDFFEWLFNDARIAAVTLGVTLTARNKGTDQEMEMCGVPYYRVLPDVETLNAKGYDVYVIENDGRDRTFYKSPVEVITI